MHVSRVAKPGSVSHPIRQSMESLAAFAFGAVGTSTQAAQAAHEAAAISLIELLVRPSYSCRNAARFGPEGDGGYVMCADEGLAIPGLMTMSASSESESCLVYSFGINHNYGFENSATEKGCTVHGYDPTVTAEAGHHFNFHQVGIGARSEVSAVGPVDTLNALRTANGHAGRDISFLKVDVEGAEWDAFEAMSDADLSTVDHLVVEFHLSGFGDASDFEGGAAPSHTTLQRYATVLRRLRKHFDLFYSHINNTGKSRRVGSNTLLPTVFECSFVGKRALARAAAAAPTVHTMAMPSVVRTNADPRLDRTTWAVVPEVHCECAGAEPGACRCEQDLGRTALCLHGRASTIDAVTTSIVDNLAAPLNADIFAFPSTDAGTAGNWNKMASFSTFAVPTNLQTLLNRTGKLQVFEEDEDTPEEIARMKADTAVGGWHYLQSFASRAYFDLSSHTECARRIRAYEASHNVRYHTLAHSRLDVHYLERLPRNIADAWKEHARLADAPTIKGVDYVEDVKPSAVVYKPDGVDNEGVIDLMGVANKRGWALLESVRDAVTNGATPYNVATKHYVDESDVKHHGIFPEQMTASVLHANGAKLTRGQWAYCRVDDMGACRYANEACRVMRNHPDVARRALGRPLSPSDNTVWVRELSDSVAAVTLCNDAQQWRSVNVSLSDDLGWSEGSKAVVSDMWSHRDLTKHPVGQLELRVPSRNMGKEGAGFRVTRVEEGEGRVVKAATSAGKALQP